MEITPQPRHYGQDQGDLWSPMVRMFGRLLGNYASAYFAGKWAYRPSAVYAVSEEPEQGSPVIRQIRGSRIAASQNQESGALMASTTRPSLPTAFGLISTGDLWHLPQIAV